MMADQSKADQLKTHEIWDDFHDAIWRFARARVDSDADADDVVQEVFLKVHDRRTQLTDEERVAGWVFRIASNAVTDLHRSRSKSPPPVDRDSSLPMSDEAVRLAQCVRPFVEMLEPKYRDALVWTEFEGMTQAEAAERAGISLSGMKSRVQRGRERLRASLEACCKVDLDARNAVMDVEARCNPDTCP